MHFEEVVEIIGKGVDAVGVAFIVIGIIVATGRYVVALRRKAADAYQFYRVGLGRALLIGLEVLVAADVIRTVAIDPTFTNVGVLGLIVLIRTFLGWALTLELDGRWPWQNIEGPTVSHSVRIADTSHSKQPFDEEKTMRAVVASTNDVVTAPDRPQAE